MTDQPKHARSYTIRVSFEDVADEEDFNDRWDSFLEDCPYPAEPVSPHDELVTALRAMLAAHREQHQNIERILGPGPSHFHMLSVWDEPLRMTRAVLAKVDQ